MVLRKKYVTQPTNIASYDYTDIAEGTGVQIFYGYDTDDGDNSFSYNLTGSTDLYSNNVYTSGSYIASGNGESFNLNFDLTPFNTPRSVKGHIRAVIPWGFKLGVAGAGCSGSVTVRAVHYDGTTETLLVSGSTTWVKHTDTAGRYYFSTIDLDVATLQNFKKGDILRFNAIGKTDNVNAEAIMLSIAHSPTDTSGESAYQVGTDLDSTKLGFHVPFNLDL